MSKYLPLNLSWRFTTWHGFVQWRSLLWRIYINIFGIFLRIPVLPLAIDKDCLTFYRRGDDIFYIWPWRRWYFKQHYNNSKKFMSLNSHGTFNSLKEIDEFWDEYYKVCEEKHKNETNFL